MKTMQKTLGVLTLIAVAGAATLFTGCSSLGGSSSGYKQADKTGASIAEFRTEIINGKQAIDATMKSLGDIATSAETDPRKAFEQFSKDVANLESTAAKIRKRSQSMQERGQAYFAQWQTELGLVSNPEIRKLAEERKAKLQETFDSIKKTTEPLKEQFDPWMANLKDLQTYLRNDLTVAGVDAAKKTFKQAHSEGADIQKAMNDLVAELNTIGATLTAAKVVPPTTEPKK